MDYISNYNIKNIYFETFYTTVTKQKLEKIKNKLNGANIFIELGFESASSEIREKALLKFIDNNLFIEKIKLIHQFDFFATTNVLLGIPFLTQKESLDDTLSSIHFLINAANVDEVVVFPLNIKKNTLLEAIKQQPPYLLSVLEIIKNLTDNELDKVIFSWFDATAEDPLVKTAPLSCNVCYNYIVETVNKFIRANRNERILIRDNLKSTNCKCEDKFTKGNKEIKYEKYE